MKNKDFDSVLKNALQPDMEPDEDLNSRILRMAESGESGNVRQMVRKPSNAVHFLPKVAAAILVLALLGTGTVYAVNYIFDKVRVSDHGVMTGNTEYIKEEDLTATTEQVTVEDKGIVQGGENDKWLTKETKLVSGSYESNYYRYPDYKTAVEDTPFDSFFTEVPGQETDVIYTTTDIGNDTMEYSLESTFSYGEGTIFVSQSFYKGNVAEDMGFGLPMTKTENQRTYTSKGGVEYTLVDDRTTEDGADVITTYVVLRNGANTSYISFRDVPEGEIETVLDQIAVN